jgi:hypothetical protein
MGTQTEEKEIGTGSFKIKVNELIHNDKNITLEGKCQ